MRDQDEYSRPNLAQQLWAHFAALFGADAIKRKFGSTPPREWESALSYLTDAQIRHGMDTLVKSGAEHIPSLPQFIASCRTAREWADDDGEIKKLESKFDKWGMAANRHLLAYAMKHPKRLAPDSTFDPVTHQAVPGPLTAKHTSVFVQFKNAWADDMRADDRGEGLPVEQQQEAWCDCMARAELALMPAVDNLRDQA
jgi:hypothetical protein